MADVVVPILAYHDVSPHPHPAFRRYSVTDRQFARQMRWLAASGYETIDMDTLVVARRDGGVLPRRPIVISFDDGYRGCAEHAVPVLRERGFTAMFYLVSGLMGSTSRWTGPAVGDELPLMSWDTARRLASEGFQCGAHTVTHPRLTDLDAARCRTELTESRRRLEDELSRPVVHLAYPFGACDSAVRKMAAEAGYTTACSTRRGLSAPDDELLALPRVMVYGHESLSAFKFRVRTGTGLRERAGRVFGWMARADSRRGSDS